VLTQLLAAAHAGVRLRLRLPAELPAKWFAGVLAEVRASAPSVAALQAVLSADALQRRERMAHDVPAFASYVIKSLRAAAQPIAQPQDEQLRAIVRDGASLALPQRARRRPAPPPRAAEPGPSQDAEMADAAEASTSAAGARLASEAGLGGGEAEGGGEAPAVPLKRMRTQSLCPDED